MKIRMKNKHPRRGKTAPALKEKFYMRRNDVNFQIQSLPSYIKTLHIS